MDEQDTIEAKIGSHAPDFNLTAHTGEQVRLSDFRGKKNVVLFFVREFDCPQCRTHVAQLGRLYPQFQETGATVIVILGNNLERTQAYASLTNAPFPVLSDPDRQVYLVYELEKYFLLIQRTASIVVDHNGVVQYLKRTTLPNVWLQESRELLGFVDSLGDRP